MKKFPAALAFLAVSLPAQAVDGVSVEIGIGDRNASIARVGVQWNQDLHWLAHTRWRLYWDVSLGRWDLDPGPIYDLGLTPVFRYAKAARGPYAEAAIGYHVLTGSRIQDSVVFSTRFQFGDHVALGYRLERYDLSVRLQHVSNAGLRNPNPGINFLELQAQYWLR